MLISNFDRDFEDFGPFRDLVTQFLKNRDFNWTFWLDQRLTTKMTQIDLKMTLHARTELHFSLKSIDFTLFWAILGYKTAFGTYKHANFAIKSQLLL